MATHALSIPAPEPGAPPTRRLVLSAFTGAAFAGVATTAAPADAAENPDAELLAVLAEFTALEAAIYPPLDPAHPATLESEAEWDDAVQPLHARQKVLLDRMCDLPTHTLEGFRARARVLIMWAELFVHDLQKKAAEGYWPEKMQIALFRDLAAERAA